LLVLTTRILVVFAAREAMCAFRHMSDEQQRRRLKFVSPSGSELMDDFFVTLPRSSI